MGGKGGSNEVKETSAQIAASEVAQKQWEIYENELSQHIDVFRGRINNFRADANMSERGSNVNLAYQDAFSNTKGDAAKAMAASGVDPSSGKFTQTMAQMSTEQGTGTTDTVNRAQAAEQDKYIAGLSDYVAMGVGEQSDALQGLSDVASLSTQKAINDAATAFNKRSSNLQLAGAAAGVGLRSYMGMQKGPTAQNGVGDGISTMRKQRDVSPYGMHNRADTLYA
ncbi:hypothetical protein A1OO_08540 [Enterovibrio norvegicus FF-33]|uniref:hypothetical protein n=1 Tax=Enterovibrio norvegicus TaxID=188144 RepID=UPI000305EB6C|nr:hypothetical protein [Enterovibrio norvegicus]OEE65846.1 hypothetical protein A1OO_08540 [Enterovibrio norvegicus FF-33]